MAGLTSEQIDKFYKENISDIFKGKFNLSFIKPNVERYLKGKKHEVNYRLPKQQLKSEYLKIAKHPDILDKVINLIGPNVYVWNFIIWIKPANGGEIIPWHSDWCNLNNLFVEKAPIISAWIAVDQIAKNQGCMEIVRSAFIKEKYRERNLLPKKLLDSVEKLSLEKNDFFLFNDKMTHFSDINKTNATRIALVIRYIDDKEKILHDYFYKSAVKIL